MSHQIPVSPLAALQAVSSTNLGGSPRQSRAASYSSWTAPPSSPAEAAPASSTEPRVEIGCRHEITLDSLHIARTQRDAFGSSRSIEDGEGWTRFDKVVFTIGATTAVTLLGLAIYIGVAPL